MDLFDESALFGAFSSSSSIAASAASAPAAPAPVESSGDKKRSVSQMEVVDDLLAKKYKLDAPAKWSDASVSAYDLCILLSGVFSFHNLLF
jgi:hypothetical protein